MDLEKQKKILLWTVATLVAINLVIIGFLLLNTYSDEEYTQEEQSSERYLFNKRESQNRPAMRMFDQVDFNDAQRQQLNNSMAKHRQKIDLYTDSIRAIRERMMEEITEEQPDTTMILQRSKKIGQYHQQIYRQTMVHFMEIRNIATSEQQNQLDDFFENVARHRGFGPNRRPHHRDHKHRMHRNRN